MAFAKAGDHLDGDERALGDILVPHPERSILFRIPSDRLSSVGIFEGDLLVVERGRAPKTGELTLLAVDGTPTLRRFLPGGIQPRRGEQDIVLQGTATVLVRTLVMSDV